MGPIALLTLALLAPSLLSFTLDPIEPGPPLAPPRSDAATEDIVVIASHPGPAPLAGCDDPWSHHPLDSSRPGAHCAAWVALDGRAPVLAVARIGESPVALLPVALRMVVSADGEIRVEATAPDPGLLRALTEALAAWAAP